LKRPPSGFTLIELLVVLFIIGVLASLTVVAVQAARQSSRNTGCLNNLRQIAVALETYREQQSVFPPGYFWLEGPGFAWGALILPQVGDANLYDEIDFRQSLGHPSNQSAVRRAVSLYVCPADRVPNGEILSGLAHASYVGCAGKSSGDGILIKNKGIGVQEIRDGLSHTLLVAERASGPEIQAVWPGASSEDGGLVTFVTGKAPTKGDGARGNISSFHTHGISAMLADCSATTISFEIDREVFEALGTRRGKELVELPE
jgi:prepilin-type N-terminal cleavage/methylation domain-containing protein